MLKFVHLSVSTVEFRKEFSEKMRKREKKQKKKGLCASIVRNMKKRKNFDGLVASKCSICLSTKREGNRQTWLD